MTDVCIDCYPPRGSAATWAHGGTGDALTAVKEWHERRHTAKANPQAISYRKNKLALRVDTRSLASTGCMHMGQGWPTSTTPLHSLHRHTCAVSPCMRPMNVRPSQHTTHRPVASSSPAPSGGGLSGWAAAAAGAAAGVLLAAGGDDADGAAGRAATARHGLCCCCCCCCCCASGNAAGGAAVSNATCCCWPQAEGRCCGCCWCCCLAASCASTTSLRCSRNAARSLRCGGRQRCQAGGGPGLWRGTGPAGLGGALLATVLLGAASTV